MIRGFLADEGRLKEVKAALPAIGDSYVTVTEDGEQQSSLDIVTPDLIGSVTLYHPTRQV